MCNITPVLSTAVWTGYVLYSVQQAWQKAHKANSSQSSCICFSTDKKLRDKFRENNMTVFFCWSVKCHVHYLDIEAWIHKSIPGESLGPSHREGCQPGHQEPHRSGRTEHRSFFLLNMLGFQNNLDQTIKCKTVTKFSNCVLSYCFASWIVRK